MGKLGALEIGLILVIILIVFGAGKLPQIGGALGKSIREFRKASKGEDESGKKAEEKTITVSQSSDKTAVDSDKTATAKPTEAKK